MPVVVEADLTDGDDLGMPGQSSQLGHCFWPEVSAFVRMHADGGVDLGIAVGESDGGAAVGQIDADRDDHLHASVFRPSEHCGEVVGEMREGEMAVGINQHKNQKGKGKE